jgi:DNA-binding NarL/FixJ family response regulator
LLGAVASLREQAGSPVSPLERIGYALYVPVMQSQIDPASWEAALSAGRAMSLVDAIAYALTWIDTPPVEPAVDASTPAFALSKREMEVVRLLVDGLSNQEIADALFISSHTVANHITSILNKLGVDSRTAAATFALRHGIV